MSRRSQSLARLAAPLALALAGVLAVSGVASAAVVLEQSGKRGLYIVADQVTEDTRMPGARCGYSAENEAGLAFFRWMRFRKPDVYARDTGDGIQQQRVTATYQLQRMTSSGWKTVASTTQSDTATETDPADFVDRKLYFNGQTGHRLRGVMVLRWWRNGEVKGMVRLRLEYYDVMWTVGSPDYIYTNYCDGSAD